MSDITRRDFINGALVTAGSSLLPFAATGKSAMAAISPPYYPPARTGLRGSHPGSFEHAHSLAWNGRRDWGPATGLPGLYDLVVVGGGLSGLAAAFFHQQKHGSDKKVLILENHDDFGGHAKRNEHTIDGVFRLGQGGSESFESPHTWDDVMLDLIRDLGIDMAMFEKAYDTDFYRRHDLRAATYFNQRVFGEDKIVRHPFCDYPGFVEGLLRPTLSFEEAVQQAPLSETGKAQLLRALTGGQHVLDLPQDELREYVRSHSYLDYLQNTLGIDDPLVLRMARHTAIDYAGHGTDIMSIYEAIVSGSLGSDPYDAWGDALDEGAYQQYVNKAGGTYSVKHPFIEHFPDGNASIARMLVKRMIPRVGPGETPEDIVTSRFDYDELDRPGNPVRLRLNSTVVNVEHEGDPGNASEVAVTYMNGDSAFRVKARGVVMAGWNMMIPYIVPDLPEAQDAALRNLSKVPLQYSTVGLRNWRAVKAAGVGMAMCPGNMHQVVGMDYPVSMGSYEFTRTPDDPCVLHLRCCPVGETPGAPPLEQFSEARRRMLGLRFEDYEAEIREHLGGMFSGDLFDFDRDVASISVNRWSHAYGWGNPGPVGRQPFGRIAIANSDAIEDAVMQSAVGQAWRAVQELG